MGSIYLRCAPTASHYLRALVDAIFGRTTFRSEIVWRRSNAHNKISEQYGPIHDVLLLFSRSDAYTSTPQFRPYTTYYVKNRFPLRDARG